MPDRTYAMYYVATVLGACVSGRSTSRSSSCESNWPCGDRFLESQSLKTQINLYEIWASVWDTFPDRVIKTESNSNGIWLIRT